MTRLALFLASLCSLGCQSFEARHLAPLEDAVIVVDDELGIARVVRVDTTPIEQVDVALAEGPAALIARPESVSEALVFTQGTLGDAHEEAIPSELVHLDRTGEIGRWTFSRQYREIGTSADGRYAYAISPWGRLVVENDVEVVDLTRPSGDGNPFALSLRSLGGEAPVAAAFSAPLVWVDGAELRVAALFAAGQLSLFDLDRPGEPPVTIPTTVDGASVGPSPVEVLFVDHELVVRTAGGTQLLVIALGEPRASAAQRFDVSLRTLAASSTVTSLAVDRRASTPRLIALSGRRVHVYDLATSIETSLELPAGYREILAFDGPAPGDPTSRPRLVLWGDSPSLTFVELGDSPTSVIGSSTLPLAVTPSDVVPDAAAGRLILFMDRYSGSVPLDVAGSHGRAPVAMIDLFDRSAIALATTSDVDRAVMSTDLSSMWIASDDGYVSRFDVDTHEQEELWLSGDVTTLLPIPGSTQRVLAFHRMENGSFTILEAGDDSPRRVSGLF